MVIQIEVMIFLLSCLLGGFFSFYYDCFRLLRQCIPHHGVVVFFEDIFYFASCSIIAFSFIVEKASGEIRGFLFVGVVVGFILYYFTISIIFMKIMRVVFDIIRKIFTVVLKILIFICLPLKLLVMLFHYFYTKLYFILCKVVKNVKIFVKNQN